MNNESKPLPLPDKKIPTSVMIIGTFEVAIALLGLIIVILVGQLDTNSTVVLIFLLIYGAIGAGLIAIQEWARYANVVLHIVAIPYTLFAAIFLGRASVWGGAAQLIIAFGIVYALTRPQIRHKFQTVVPKKKRH